MATTLKKAIKESSFRDTFNTIRMIFTGKFELQTFEYKCLVEEVEKAETISPKQALRKDFHMVIKDMHVAKAEIEEELEHSDG